MALLRRGKNLYFAKRVPKEFQDVDPRGIVQISLKTDSEREAREKAVAVEAALMDFWVAKKSGAGDAERYRALVNVAARKGFTYRPLRELYAREGIEGLLARVDSLSDDELADGVSLDAVTGREERAAVLLSSLPERYFEIARADIVGKSDDQVRRWKNPRLKAFRNLVAQVGDKDLNKITRDDALNFRDWWQDRLVSEGKTPNSANKDFSYINSTLAKIIDHERLAIDNPFVGLKFKEKKKHRPPFSVSWIRENFTLEALAGLNDEARDILLAMVNTGCRPSEICGLLPDEIILDDVVPHIIIRGNELRSLKNDSSARRVPLCGVSLAAMSRHPEGFPRYAGKDKFSDTANKFLRENKLLETEKHSAYSLRHSFEDRMTALSVPDRIAAELMGHALRRERYGAGPSLAQLADVVQRLAV